MDATRRAVMEVERAIRAHKRAIARLIRLLKHEDEAVRSGAAAALKGLDPPPTLALGEALLGSRDTDFQLRIVKVLVGLAVVDQVRVLCVLCEAFRQRRDLEVKRAVATALLVLVTERSGPSPSPPERPAQDPDREGKPRVRDESSSGRVDR
jgi:HEAT repeat protein